MQTILFKSNWDKHPNAIPDWNTSSVSAKRMAKFYYEVEGIENFDFFLSLLNPAVQGLDPRDPNLTEYERAIILEETKLNFWYYIREVARVPGKGGGDAVPFKLHRGNIATFFGLLSGATTWYLGPRQFAGKSLTVDMINSWVMNFAGKNSTINLLTKDDKLRTTNLLRLKDIRKELPSWMQSRSKMDVMNTTEFSVALLNNRYVGNVPSKAEKDAKNKARGFTSEFNHLDEPAFQAWIGAAAPVMLASGSMARKIAREIGAPNWTAFTTTAGSMTDRDGKATYEMLSKAADWSDKYFDSKDINHFRDTVCKSSRGNKFALNCTFYYYMLGVTREEIEQAISDAEMTVESEIMMEFYVQWFRGNTSSIIPKEVIAVMNANLRKAKTDPSSGIMVNWYYNKGKKKIEKDQRFLVVLDPSEGVGGDAMGILLVDPYTGETLASVICYNTNIAHFSKWLFDTFILPFPNSIFLPESRMGRGIIDTILEFMEKLHIDPFKRIFNFIVSGQDSMLLEEYNRIKIGSKGRKFQSFVDRNRKYFGFPTSGSGETSRKNLYGRALRELYTTRAHVLYDKTLVDQLSNLVEINGRVDHPPGMHDDLCIPAVLSQWFLTQSKNLSGYGLEPEKILKFIPFNSSDLKDQSPREYNREKTKHKMQVKYRKDLFKLIKKLNKAKSPVKKSILHAQINYIKSKIEVEEGENLSIANLLHMLETGELFTDDVK